MIAGRKISDRSFWSIIMLLLCLNTEAQFWNRTPVQPGDTIKTDAQRSPHSLFAGAGYGSNLVYLGSTISQNQFYSYASISYGLGGEFYASISSVHLQGLDPFLAFHSGSLTYNHVFNSWFDISAGICRYQVAPSLTETLFSNFTYGDLTLGFDWRLLYSKISAGALFSNDDQAYFQFRNSRYFVTPDFFKGRANISFDPYINLLFGTLIESKTSTNTSVTLSTPSRKWRKYRENPSATTTYSERFGLMDAEFGLPVALNTNLMTIEAEACYVLPAYDDPDFPGSKGFIFMLSAYFRIF